MSVAAAWARCKETVVARQTLITFVGLRDPYAHDPHEDGRHKGPILTLLDERSFDRVILLGRPHRADHGERTRQALRGMLPGDEDAILLNLLQRRRVLVRQGRFEALNTFAARLYSQGFQIELVLLD